MLILIGEKFHKSTYLYRVISLSFWWKNVSLQYQTEAWRNHIFSRVIAAAADMIKLYRTCESVLS